MAALARALRLPADLGRGLQLLAAAAGCAALSWSLGASALDSPLTVEKRAFARDYPCPLNGYKSIACVGYTIVYPACAPWRTMMKWAKDADVVAQQKRAAAFCTCRATPVEIFACTTRGCRALAVNCKGWP